MKAFLAKVNKMTGVLSARQRMSSSLISSGTSIKAPLARTTRDTALACQVQAIAFEIA
jgi:hypothetical protein